MDGNVIKYLLCWKKETKDCSWEKEANVMPEIKTHVDDVLGVGQFGLLRNVSKAEAANRRQLRLREQARRCDLT